MEIGTNPNSGGLLRRLTTTATWVHWGRTKEAQKYREDLFKFWKAEASGNKAEIEKCRKKVYENEKAIDEHIQRLMFKAYPMETF